ncbi:hypothetical protein J42TS3_06170 [Paenibacillus vini]|uniref:SLH domain-containing protein n=2 Tax=Paenibacillus vini TaxID=1476024 RepID=A0ABQ4M7G9_9BACL|nr:hypothetical protein J42TS3_06170 [Paenibacillus vini]
MKKILSVALSTAMAFSMFASVAFGADGAKLTDEQQFNALKEAGILTGYPDGQSHLEKALTRAELAKIIVKSIGLEPVTGVATYKDKNYTVNHWAAPFIESATQAGILNGKDATKKLFDPTGNVTVQELAKVLATALKLDVPTDANNTASAWAKGYVAAAIKAGYLQEGINYQANASRSQAVVAAYAIYEAAQIPTVTKYEVKDSKNVEFTLSNGDVVKVALETALEANKATDVKFTHNGHDYTHSVTYVVTTATKVESASASNLKEVDVKFDGKVDQSTATNKDNYTLKSGTVDSATLLDDEITVRLVVKDALANQKANKVTVKNVKAGDKVINGDVEFTPLDNALPEVVEVKALGTKAVKVVFSEPIKKTTQSNFKLDGKTFYGNPTDGSREVILTPYDSSSLAVGEHTVVVAGVEDYFGLKSLSSEHKFTVVEDTQAPTVAKVEATLERVVITFSEEVDPDTVNKDNIYWKSGDTKKKAASVKKLASDKYEVEFNASDRLPSYETTLYIENVKDYSGNKITQTEVKVNATVDQTRPEVTEVKSNSDVPTEINVTFSKAVDAADRKYYTVKDKDGKIVPIKDVVKASGNTTNRVFTIILYKDLPEGTNTLKVSGVADLTALKNVMIDHTTDIKVGDVTGPKYQSVSANSATRTVEIAFNEKMDLGSIGTLDNYRVVVNGVERAMPEDAEVTPVRDGKSVRIILPEKIGNTVVSFTKNGVAGTVSDVVVAGVKDAAGNVIQGWTVHVPLAEVAAAVKAYDNDIAQPAVLDAKDTIKVRFNQPISSINTTDFVLSGGTINSVSIDGDLVTLKTSDLGTAANVSLALKADNTAKAGNGNAVEGAANIAIKDKVKPEVTAKDGSTLYVNGNVITLPFSEALDSATASFYANDLVVTRYTDSTTLKVSEYSTAVSGNNLLITIKDGKAAGLEYTVQVKDAKFIKDLSDNTAADSGTYVAFTNGVNNPAPVVTGVENGKTYNGSVTPASADADIKTVVLTKDGVVVPYTLGNTIAGNGAYVLTVTDNAGNQTVVSFTIAVVATDAITNAAAKFDGFLMTTVSADLDAEVTSVEIYKGANKIQDPKLSNGKLDTQLLGVAKGDVLKVVAYKGTQQVGTVDVTVQ